MHWQKNRLIRKEKRDEDQNKENKGNGTGKGKGKSSGKGRIQEKRKSEVKRRVLQESDESDNEKDDLEWYCLICYDSYSNSKPREKWIECIMCKNWAHLNCLERDDVEVYICPNCNSDDENDE